MPQRPYTDVVLDLPAQNFVGTVDVTGKRAPDDPSGTPLGQFTLFDLTARRLARSTTLHLQESAFPVLGIRLHLLNESTGKPMAVEGTLAAQILRGALVPPSRERQTLFDVALTASAQTNGGVTVSHFTLPAHLPIERVLVRLAPGYTGNFNRQVRITAQPVGQATGEVSTGTISRVHLTAAGHLLSQQQLTLDATLGSNLQGPAEATVTIENGSEPPLPVVAIALETRRRSLCFHSGAEPLTLLYGNPGLRAAETPDTADASAASSILLARLGPEIRNPTWVPAEPEEPRNRQEPRHLVWMVLLGLGALLGLIAIRSTRIIRH